MFFMLFFVLLNFFNFDVFFSIVPFLHFFFVSILSLLRWDKRWGEHSQANLCWATVKRHNHLIICTKLALNLGLADRVVAKSIVMMKLHLHLSITMKFMIFVTFNELLQCTMDYIDHVLHDEHIIAVREEPVLDLVFYQRNVTKGMCELI